MSGTKIRTSRRGTGARARTRRPRRGAELAEQRLFDEVSRPQQAPKITATLEEKMLTTWAALAAGYPVECPVCSGVLTADDGCRDCGSELS